MCSLKVPKTQWQKMVSHLGEDDLQRAKEDHPGVVGDVAGVVDVSMEAVRAADGPARQDSQQISSSRLLKRAYLPNNQAEETKYGMLKENVLGAGHLAVTLYKGVAAGLGEPLTWQQCLQSLCSQWRFRPYSHLHHTSPLKLNDSIQQQIYISEAENRGRSRAGERHTHIEQLRRQCSTCHLQRTSSTFEESAPSELSDLSPSELQLLICNMIDIPISRAACAALRFTGHPLSALPWAVRVFPTSLPLMPRGAHTQGGR